MDRPADLVRTDTLKYLRAEDVFGGRPRAAPQPDARPARGRASRPPGAQQRPADPRKRCASEWGDYVWWDRDEQRAQRLTRDEVGGRSTIGDPLLEGASRSRSPTARRCAAGPVFDLIASTPPTSIRRRSRSSPGRRPPRSSRWRATSPPQPGTTLFAVGMGPNQFFNNDNKDRDIFLLAALTGNVGRITGNVGSYAGNYRVALFNGVPQYINENPFDLELDPGKPARPKQYWRPESAHYYNHEDHPLKVGNRILTGDDAHADAHQVAVVRQRQLDPRQRQVALQHRGHQRPAQHRDDRRAGMVVVDLLRVGRRRLRRRLLGGAEAPGHDRSVTNPFLTVFPRTPLPRAFETRGDIEVLALVGQQLAELTGDQRFGDCGSSSTRAASTSTCSASSTTPRTPRATTSSSSRRRPSRGSRPC